MSTDSTEVRQVRLARNQALFRDVNERVEKVAEQYTALAPLAFICECAISDCGRRVELTREEYESIRSNPTHFFVLPDHVFPEVEAVVEDRGQFVIVEKFGIGGRVAAAADGRRHVGDDVR
jgi:hypothetical protein